MTGKLKTVPSSFDVLVEQGVCGKDFVHASFDVLVEQGVCGKDFVHAPALVSFYRVMVAETVAEFPVRRPLCVLDVGCGTGAWLEVLADLFAEWDRPVKLAGFDLSGNMIAVAREKLDGRIDPACLRQSDALDPMAYRFEPAPDGFDLILAYDFIQQLPNCQQARAVDLMVSA